jgi:RNA polymerase sigma factor (sigma-70 family)
VDARHPFERFKTKKLNRTEEVKMQNWQKHRNYRKHKNPDGSFTYVITVDGVDTEVTETVYKAYSQFDRRERYCAERDIGKKLSLERMDEDDVLLNYLTDYHIDSAEDAAIRAILAEKAMAAFMTLEPDEQNLIHALVFDGVTEQSYADIIGLSQKGVNKRKYKILKKLKILVLKP